MNSRSLAQDYLRRARSRRKALEGYLQDQDYADVVREAQETVELSLRAILRMVGIEPPKVHDVAALLREYEDRLPGVPVAELARTSTQLRKERELAFYGDLDFLPTEQYTQADAEQAMGFAGRAVDAALAFWERIRVEE